MRLQTTPAASDTPSIFGPEEHGFKAWAYDPQLSGTTSTPLTPAGTLFVVKFRIRKVIVVTNVELAIITQGATLTAGQCKAALYQDGSLVGVTADQAAAWVTTGLKTMPLVGGPFTLQPGVAHAAFWYNGTTGPAPYRTISGSAMNNIGIAAASSRVGTADTGITTTAPATLGVIVPGTTPAYWAAVS